MGIDRYLRLLLIGLALFFAASFFYYMNLAREISVAGTRIYGAYLPLVAGLQQQETLRGQFWRALEATLRSGDATALNRPRAAASGARPCRPAKSWRHCAARP